LPISVVSGVELAGIVGSAKPFSAEAGKWSFFAAPSGRDVDSVEEGSGRGGGGTLARAGLAWPQPPRNKMVGSRVNSTA
jgi:hypothetical protein